MAEAGHNSGDVGGVAADRLRSFIERIERLEDEKAALSSDIKEVFAEAKSTGFDTKAMRLILRERKMDEADRRERAELLDLYRNALGMLADTPLGTAAMPGRMSMTDFERMARWVADGETGISSETIALTMCGLAPKRSWNYPHDLDDFRRCKLLLARYPEWRKRLGEMGKVCPTWAALAARWDEIDRAYEAEEREKPNRKGRTSGTTYKLMRSIIEPVEDRSGAHVRVAL